MACALPPWLTHTHTHTDTQLLTGYTISSGHDYTIGTLEVLHACDACADMGMTYSVTVQCTDCVVFPSSVRHLPSQAFIDWQYKNQKNMATEKLRQLELKYIVLTHCHNVA